MAPRHSYELAAKEASDDEDQPFVGTETTRWNKITRVPNRFNKFMACVNTVLALLLATLLLLVASPGTKHETTVTVEPKEPYSPARVSMPPVIKKFKPSLVFQSEPSEKVDAAWTELQNPAMGYVGLDKDENSKLFEQQGRPTIFSPWEHGKYLYAPSMYHQLHCLDILRRSFHRDRYFPGVPDHTYFYHKNHCLDFLRQTVLCHADPEMVYWWHRNYTTFTSDGTPMQSDWFKGLSRVERFENANIFWDVEHSCRPLEPLREWVSAHPFFPKGFDPQVKQVNCESQDCREAMKNEFP